MAEKAGFLKWWCPKCVTSNWDSVEICKFCGSGKDGVIIDKQRYERVTKPAPAISPNKPEMRDGHSLTADMTDTLGELTQRAWDRGSQDENSLMAEMTDTQRILFVTQMNGVRKSRITGFVLTFFLGGFGAHHFYLGRIGLGVLYAIFIWTGIPSIIGIIEMFFIGERVDLYNQEKALEIANKIKSLPAK